MGFRIKGTSRIFGYLNDTNREKLSLDSNHVYNATEWPVAVRVISTVEKFEKVVTTTTSNVSSGTTEVPAGSTVTGTETEIAEVDALGADTIETTVIPQQTFTMHKSQYVSDNTNVVLQTPTGPQSTGDIVGDPDAHTFVITPETTITTKTSFRLKERKQAILTNNERTFESIYPDNGIGIGGKPVPSLQNVEVSVEGDLGMLLRVRVSYEVYTFSDFKRLEYFFLRPNRKISLDVQYIGKSPWDRKFKREVNPFKNLALNNLSIVKYDFVIQTNNRITCTFECIGSHKLFGKSADMYALFDTSAVPLFNGKKYSKKLIVDLTKIQAGGPLPFTASVIETVGAAIYNLNPNVYEIPIKSLTDWVLFDVLSGREATQIPKFKPGTTIFSSAPRLREDDALYGMVVYTELPENSQLIQNKLNVLKRSGIFQSTENNRTYAIYLSLGYIINVIINQIIIPGSIQKISKLPANSENNLLSVESNNSYNTDVVDTNVEFICSKKYLRAPNYKYLCSAEPLKAVWVHSKSVTDPLERIGKYSYGVDNGQTNQTPGNSPDQTSGYNFGDLPFDDENKFSIVGDNDELDLTRILINYDTVLSLIEQSKDKNASKEPYELLDDDKSATVKLSIHQFLKKLFDLIRDVSGNMFDLDIVEWSAKTDDAKKMNFYIVNKKYNKIGDLPMEDEFTPVVFDPINGDNVSRTSDVTMTLPTDVMAMNAFAEGLNSSTANVLADDFVSDDEKIYESIKTLYEARQYYFSDDSVLAADANNIPLSAAVKTFVDSLSRDVVRKDLSVRYPLKLNLSIAGINGFEYGDIISLSYLKDLPGYRDTIFTVLSVVHTIQNNQWVTDLKTIVDLNPSAAGVKTFNQTLDQSRLDEIRDISSTPAGNDSVARALQTWGTGVNVLSNIASFGANTITDVNGLKTIATKMYNALKAKDLQPADFDYKDFVSRVLSRIGAVSDESQIGITNRIFMYAWCLGESTRAKYNPMATTYNNTADSGQTNFNTNNPPVKNYSTFDFGLDSTVNTLNLSYYDVIREALRRNITGVIITASDIYYYTRPNI